MTSTEKATTAVEQALFHRAEDGASVAASSLTEHAEQVWFDVLGPHLGFAETPDTSPVHALAYVVTPDGFAAVLRKTWSADRPGFVATHALLSKKNVLTAAVALSTSDWSGWRQPPHPTDRRLPTLSPDELWAPDSTGPLRARALAQGDMLARSLAWLLEAPASPLGLVGCPVADRTAVLWALLEIAGPLLPRREWTFATHADGSGNPASITFFPKPPSPDPVAHRIVIDLGREQGASPQNEYRANALVYRYEYGIDPPGVDLSPAVLPAPVPVPAAPAQVAPRPAPPPPEPARSPLPPWQWAALVRDLTEAGDVRAVDGALVELEYAVRQVDDRDEVRKALANAGWATEVIDRHVPFELRDAVFDRLAAIAFGATGPGRATPGARADARRLAAEADATDLVRAIARAGTEGDVADVLAKRWLHEHTPVQPGPRRGPVGRLVRHGAFLVTVALVVTFVLGGLVGGVIW